MDRLDGYIDLDLLLKEDFEELKNQGIIEDLTQFFKLYKINVNQKSYFFKQCGYQDAITELIVNEMLDYAEITNIKYDLACINGAYGVISESFEKDGYNILKDMTFYKNMKKV